MDFGTYLRKQRETAGLSLRHVVLMTNNETDKTTLSRVEQNERTISLKLAYLLAQVYGVDFETLAKKAIGNVKVRKLTAAEKTRKYSPGRPKKKK